MKIVFAGTPAAALPALEALVSSSHQVVGVVTRPPARKGRSKRLIDSPVGAWAKEQCLPVLETSHPSQPEAFEWLRERRADLGVIVAYGALLRADVLAVPSHGWINLHYSALPKLRGAAPVQRAVLAQDPTIGTTVFQLDEGMDSGEILSVVEHDLSPRWTSGEALDYLSRQSADQLVSAVDAIADGTAVFSPQNVGPNDENVTFAPKLGRGDAFVDFQLDPDATAAQIRAVTPAPGAWTTLRGQTFKLGPVKVALEVGALKPGQILVEKTRVLVGCRNGAVELGQVAPAGKSWMDAAAWARGARLSAEEKLGERE